MPNIASVLDRLEDRFFDITKAWVTSESLVVLKFDLSIVEKDIEQLKTLIKEEEEKRKCS